MKPEERIRDDLAREVARNLQLNHDEQWQQLTCLESEPVHVALPTGQLCNLRCAFCTDRRVPTPYSPLAYDLFLRFAPAIRSALRIQLYGWGEPLANPDYAKIFDYVAHHYPGRRLHISTNGTLLDTAWSERLLDYRRCLLNISINAATRETYKRLTERDIFLRVVSNVEELMRAKERRDLGEFVVTASFVMTRLNIHELPDFVDLSASLGIRHLKLSDLMILTDHHETLSLSGCLDHARSALAEARERALAQSVTLDLMLHSTPDLGPMDKDGFDYEDLPSDLRPLWTQVGESHYTPQLGECYAPWQTLMLNQKGEAFPCCRYRASMGNVLEDGLDQVWNGSSFRALRRSINTFRPPEACRECPVRMGLDCSY